MAKHPAIFLDRAGTIMEDNGLTNLLSNIEFYSCTYKVLQNLPEHFVLFIITNQSGRLYNLDLTKSFMVGDHPSGIQCLINIETPIYLLDGHGKKYQNEIKKEVCIVRLLKKHQRLFCKQ